MTSPGVKCVITGKKTSNSEFEERKRRKREDSMCLQQREKARAAEGGGEMFLMRQVSDVSGKDGDLLLFEYSEEHPILLSQPGMASRLRNYHKRVSSLFI